jgi:hypothetical protein
MGGTAQVAKHSDIAIRGGAGEEEPMKDKGNARRVVALVASAGALAVLLGAVGATAHAQYTRHLIRDDLYSGQPCAPGGEPYVHRGLIGYYECVHA